MKTAVSIPDDLFTEAELLAQNLGTSRSQIYSRALREFVARHFPERLTEAMNRSLEEDASFRREAARRVLERVEWSESRPW